MRRMSDIVRNQKPLMLPTVATARHACVCMRERKVGAVLVTDRDRHLLDIFAGRDAVGRVLAEGKDPDTTQIGDVMTRDPRSLSPEHPAIDALRLMYDIGCRHIPVVVDGRVLGIVSRADFRGIELDRLDEETDFWERL
jgi:CBS domain-containing protein